MSLENVKAIILILSGKGGVGKSSITTQLALSLSLAGKSVGILDIDLTGPSIPRFLGLEDAKIKQAPGGWLPVEVHPAQILAPLPLQTSGAARTRSQDRLTDGDDLTDSLPPPPPLPPPPAQTTSYSTTTGEIGSLRAISLAFLLPTRASAVIWRGPKKTAMVRQFLTDVLWPPTDYLLIDTPPGTSDEHIALAETLLSATTSIRTTPMLSSGSHSTYQKPYLAGAVIVTTPQAVAVNDVRKEVNFCKKTNIGILGVVENMAGFVCECCGEETNLFGKGGGEVMAQEFGIPFLGRCAMDGAWGRLIEEGKRPVYGDLPNGDAAEGETQQRLATDQKAQHFHDLTEQKTHERDEELLVDKYRSCKLCATFEGLTGQLVNIIEDTPYT